MNKGIYIVTARVGAMVYKSLDDGGGSLVNINSFTVSAMD